MKARTLLAGAMFGPEALRVIGEAFDGSWSEISHHFEGDPQIEEARVKLAHAVLAVADDGSRDVEALKKAALQVMALSYPLR